jgi:hypothetical protein
MITRLAEINKSVNFSNTWRANPKREVSFPAKLAVIRKKIMI